MEDERELSEMLTAQHRESLTLTDEEIRSFFHAFKAIDENGDGRLQRSELFEVLEQIEHDAPGDTLDRVFAEVSPKSRKEGLELIEFLDLMSLEKSRAGSLGDVMRKNMAEVMSYSDHRSRDLAQRNAIVHKKTEVNEDSLSQFLKKGERCAQCRHPFDPAENDDQACQYHPGPSSTHEAKENHLARVTFKCCGREQIGTNPALVKAVPCVTSQHRTRDQLDAYNKAGGVHGIAQPVKPVKLHGIPMSASCLPVIVLCQDAGLSYEVVTCDLTQGAHLTPAFKAMNPMHCIPTLDDNGFQLWEARAIARYLCDQYKLGAYYPRDPKRRALCDLALDFHMASFYKITAAVLYPAAGWAPAPSDEELQAVEAALQTEIWPAMSKMIKTSGGPLIGGASPNLADIFFAVHVEMTALRCPASFVAKHSALCGYSKLVKGALPGWDKATAAAREFFTPKKGP